MGTIDKCGVLLYSHENVRLFLKYEVYFRSKYVSLLLLKFKLANYDRVVGLC